MKNKKILVLGSNGQLGADFVNAFKTRGINYVAPAEKDSDITDFDKINVLISEISPDIIINCAAYNEVDTAEDNSAVAYLVNGEAVANIARICKDKNIFLVHHSSDYVFDGKKQDLYYEDDNVEPINIYGKSKLMGEMAIKDSLDKYLIFRLSWVIGSGKQNFLYKVSMWAENNRVIKVSADEVSVPTFTDDVVDIVILSLKRGLTGLYHLTNSGYASRYELAKLYVQKMKLSNLVIPVSMSNFETKAERPGFSAMSNNKLETALNIKIPNWNDSLIKYVEILK